MSGRNFWVITGVHGHYSGAFMSRVETIARHVHGLYRWVEEPTWGQTKLKPMQREDWLKCRRKGDRCVKVRLVEASPPSPQEGR